MAELQLQSAELRVEKEVIELRYIFFFVQLCEKIFSYIYTCNVKIFFWPGRRLDKPQPMLSMNKRYFSKVFLLFALLPGFRPFTSGSISSISATIHLIDMFLNYTFSLVFNKFRDWNSGFCTLQAHLISELILTEAEFMNVQFRWVSGHNLRLKVSVHNVYITNQFQTTFAWGGGGGE